MIILKMRKPKIRIEQEVTQIEEMDSALIVAARESLL